jgi:hypothetical protein
MIVVLETQIDPATTQFPEPVQPVYEIEWVQLERPVKQAPFFKALFPDPTRCHGAGAGEPLRASWGRRSFPGCARTHSRNRRAWCFREHSTA